MKKDKFKIYTLEIILLIILLFALFVPSIVNKRVLACIILAFAILIAKTNKKRNVKALYSKQVTILMTAFAVIYLVGFYLSGLYFGYYEAPAKFSVWTLDTFIFPYIILIFSSEITRNVLIAQKAKLSGVLITTAMAIIDLILYSGVYEITDLEGMLAIVGYIIFASISCNLLYNYISKRYGIWPIVIFRMITMLYAYIIPFIPNMLIFFKSFFRMIYPYIIYLVLEKAYGKENISISSDMDKRKTIISTSIVFTILIFFIMLVSCQFKFGMLTIGSGSMTGTLNVGDAIVYEKYEGQKILKGQIIVYNRDGKRIIHRVVEVRNINGTKKYITKGDANSENDSPNVTEEEIFGVYKFKISYIGYPSLWLRDIFNVE